MPRRTYRSAGRRSGTRPRTTWNQTRSNFVFTGAAGSVFLDLSHPTITSGENSGGSCIRVIGDVRFENAGANPDHINVGVAIMVVTEDALGAGVIPSPFTDLRQDFYFWRATAFHLDQAGGAQSSVDAYVELAKIDLRTSRRLREGYRLVMGVEKDATSEVSWNFTTSLRTLWRLQA